MEVSYHLIVCIVVFSYVSEDRFVSTTSLNRVERAVEKYSNKYDKFDVAGVLASARLVKRYGDCLMDRGPCPPEGRFLKDIVPDAIATECSKCNNIQKKQAGLILQHLLLHYRPLFLELCDKYDPTGKARKQYGIDTNEADEYEDYDEA
uniref:Chemosensory protein 9 n=1 Tax=Colaphellus bowringi TaxID=561076 RepID=A0A0S3J3A4_9CUCU|nr:chemosensory protein 9 [Colaphellus bowringi]